MLNTILFTLLTALNLGQNVIKTDILVVGGGTAGAAAALSVHKNTTPADLPINELKTLLESHGAILR